jgi:hypothetical protein
VLPDSVLRGTIEALLDTPGVDIPVGEAEAVLALTLLDPGGEMPQAFATMVDSLTGHGMLEAIRKLCRGIPEACELIERLGCEGDIYWRPPPVDVSAQVRMSLGPIRYDELRERFRMVLTIVNHSGKTLEPPLYLGMPRAIQNLHPRGTEVSRFGEAESAFICYWAEQALKKTGMIVGKVYPLDANALPPGGRMQVQLEALRSLEGIGELPVLLQGGAP